MRIVAGILIGLALMALGACLLFLDAPVLGIGSIICGICAISLTISGGDGNDKNQ